MRNTFDNTPEGASVISADVETLRLFVEQFARLESSSFVREVQQTGLHITTSMGGNAGQRPPQLVAPTREQVDAYLLTARLFLQDNERISIRRVAGLVEAAPISEDVKSSFRATRDALNRNLDAAPAVMFDDDPRTRRDILMGVLYGHRAHLNADHRAQYERWIESPCSPEQIEFDFVSALYVLHQGLWGLAGVCELALEQLEA